MARKKISAMTAASAYTGSNEFYELVQGGNTRQGSHALLKTYFHTLYAPYVKYAKLSDTQTSGTQGGTFTSGAWRTRTINTEDSDAGNIVSISGNAFTPISGTYIIRATAPAYTVDWAQAKLRNTAAGSDTIIGTGGYYPSGGRSDTARSEVVGRFTANGTDAYEIQHYCSATQATNGFGVAMGFGVSEVYTIVELWKVG